MSVLSGAMMALGAYAQSPLVFDLSTGVTGPSTAPVMIAPGSGDDTWTVRLPNGTTVTPLVCNPLFASWATNSHCTSGWISPSLNASNNPQSIADGNYTYRTEFRVRGYCHPQRVRLNIGSMGGDNRITGLRVNNNVYTLTVPTGDHFNPLVGSSTVTINPAHVFSNYALNTLEIIVNNTAGGNTPTGFNFCGNLTVEFNIPSFSVAVSQFGSYYSLTATPDVAQPAGFSYAWFIEEVVAGGGASPFFINNPGGAWWTNPINTFVGFDDPANTYIGNYSSLPGSPSPGRFEYNKTYRISRGTWSEFCSYNGYAVEVRVVKSGGGLPHVIVTETKAPDFSHLVNQGVTASVIDTDLSDALHVFPNPSTGMFTVTLGKAAEGTVEVMDLLGKKIQTLRLNANTNTYQVDLNGYAKGIYVINITTGGKTQSKKVVLE